MRTADSTSQQAVLAILPKISATLSFGGSAWIFVEVTTHPTKRANVYHRLLLAMSLYDMFESILNFCSTWAIPHDTLGVYDPRGNVTTCEIQGFFLQLGLAIPIYNAWLSVYYYLLVCRGWSQHEITRIMEPSAHGTAFVMAAGTAVAALWLDLYNSANLWCWIAPLPAGCDQNDDILCERGDKSYLYRWIFYFVPLWTCIVVACITVVLVNMKASGLEEATHHRATSSSFQWQSSGKHNDGTQDHEDDNDDDDGGVALNNTSTHDARGLDSREGEETARGEKASQGRKKKTNAQKILRQSLWYLAAFYMTHLYSTINRALQLSIGHTFYPLLVLHSIFDPLQGFLNALVYRRPIYLRHRRQHREEGISRLFAWYMAFRWHFCFDAELEHLKVAVRKQEKRDQAAERATADKASGLYSTNNQASRRYSGDHDHPLQPRVSSIQWKATNSPFDTRGCQRPVNKRVQSWANAQLSSCAFDDDYEHPYQAETRPDLTEVFDNTNDPIPGDTTRTSMTTTMMTGSEPTVRKWSGASSTASTLPCQGRTPEGDGGNRSTTRSAEDVDDQDDQDDHALKEAVMHRLVPTSSGIHNRTLSASSNTPP